MKNREKMRETKFRGKRVDNGEWVYGYYGVKGEGTEIEQYCIMDSVLNSGTTSYFYFSDIEVIPETVGQFTGLTDKNGVKIYEGDACNVKGKGKCCVVFDYGCFIFKGESGWQNPITHQYSSENCEVTGNIHEQ